MRGDRIIYVSQDFVLIVVVFIDAVGFFIVQVLREKRITLLLR